MIVADLLERLEGLPQESEVIFESREYRGELDVHGYPVENEICSIDVRRERDPRDRRRWRTHVVLL